MVEELERVAEAFAADKAYWQRELDKLRAQELAGVPPWGNDCRRESRPGDEVPVKRKPDNRPRAAHRRHPRGPKPRSPDGRRAPPFSRKDFVALGGTAPMDAVAGYDPASEASWLRFAVEIAWLVVETAVEAAALACGTWWHRDRYETPDPLEAKQDA